MQKTATKDLILMLSKEVGAIIRSSFSSDTKTRWKENNTPVTETDLRVNYLALAFLNQYFPEHNVLGEEKSDMSKKSDYLWICDPIDGTLAFSHSIPICAFSLSLVHKGEVILGSVYDPFLERFFYAEKGKGAFLNDRRIHVTPSNSLINKVVGISGGHGDTLNQGFLYNALREADAKVINLYSILYMGALVASGELSAVIFGGRSSYDGAAIKILVEEAGGIVTDLHGKDQLYNKDLFGYIASNGPVHNQLVEIVKQKGLQS
jgi:myo-inositol-1(or 4)-monophosphatase